MVEDENLGLTVRQEAYFPTIYEEDSYIFKSYTRKKPIMEESELVIVEMGPMSGKGGYRRRNYYRKNDDGHWVHQRYEGTSWYFFDIKKE